MHTTPESTLKYMWNKGVLKLSTMKKCGKCGKLPYKQNKKDKKCGKLKILYFYV